MERFTCACDAHGPWRDGPEAATRDGLAHMRSGPAHLATLELMDCQVCGIRHSAPGSTICDECAGVALESDRLADERRGAGPLPDTCCVYCGHALPDADRDELGLYPVPAPDDDAAWSALAPQHAPGCPWFVSRAWYRSEDGRIRDEAAR